MTKRRPHAGSYGRRILPRTSHLHCHYALLLLLQWDAEAGHPNSSVSLGSRHLYALATLPRASPATSFASLTSSPMRFRMSSVSTRCPRFNLRMVVAVSRRQVRRMLIWGISSRSMDTQGKCRIRRGPFPVTPPLRSPGLPFPEEAAGLSQDPFPVLSNWLDSHHLD